MLNRIFKPKWQHKDPAVRKDAVRRLQDEDLLLQIINNDSDSEVKATAIAGLSNMQILLPLTKKADTAGAASQQLVNLLCEGTSATKNDDFGAFVETLSEQPLLKQIAENCSDIGGRNAAVRQLQDEEILAQILLKDNNATVRLSAAEKLSTESLIRSTIKQLGKRDKRATHALKQSLGNQAKAVELQQHIDKLAEAFNALGYNERWQLDNASLASLTNEWGKLKAEASNEQNTQIQTEHDAASQRVLQHQEDAASQTPILEAKQSQCELMEKFSTMLSEHHRISDTQTDEFQISLDTFVKDWNEIAPLPEKQEAAIANRFHGALTQSRKQVETLKQNVSQSSNLEKLLHHGERMLEQKQIKKARTEKLFGDWDSQKLPLDQQLAGEYRERFSHLQEKLSSRLTQQEKQRDGNLEKIQAWLQEIESSLESGSLGESQHLGQQIHDMLAETQDIPSDTYHDIQHRLNLVQPRLKELSGWRHWGTDRAREELIEEAIELDKRELEVEARATAVKSLRDRWKGLGKIDPVSRQRLWKQFDDACSKAYEPCKAHYNEQAKERSEHLQIRDTICDELDTLHQETDWQSPDWHAVEKAFQSLRNSWTKAGSVSRKDWVAIQERYRAATARLDTELDKERVREYSRREQMIVDLEAIAETGALDDAIEQAKNAQHHWAPTISGKRSKEQKLWKRYRSVCDAIFDRRKTNQEELSAEQVEQVAARETLCAEIEDKILNQSLQGGELESFISAWQALPNLNSRQARELDKRQARAVEQARKLQGQRAINKALEYLSELSNSHLALEKLEVETNTIDDSISRYISEALETSSYERLQRVLIPRAKRSLLNVDSVTRTKTTRDRASLLLDMEILLDIPSPDDKSTERMERRVQRLSEVMSSGDRQKPESLALQKFEQYCQSGPVSAEHISQLQPRLDAILASLQSSMQKMS